MISPDKARDEINATFYVAWKSQTADIVGYIPQVLWQGSLQTSIPDGSKFWARVSQQTVTDEQATLSTCEGKPGQKKYTVRGLVFVQIFCPRSSGQAFQVGQKLAMVARKSFRGQSTAGKVWFRNARIQELPPEELFERFNVVAEFEYDELS